MHFKCFIKYLLVICLFVSYNTYSQNNFDLEIKHFQLQDTVLVNDNIVASYYIKNNGPSVFTGNLAVNYMFTQTMPSIPGGLNPNLVNNVSVSSIAVNDSILINETITASSSRFSSGNNIVIVWPKYRNTSFNDVNPTNDYRNKTLFVKSSRTTSQSTNNNTTALSSSSTSQPLELNEVDVKGRKPQILEKPIKTNVFPNPVIDKLEIHIATESEYYEINILNMLGNSVKYLRTTNNKVEISFTDLVSGYYFVKIESITKTEYFKIFKR